MKKAIKGMLNNIVGEELGEKIFEANFPKPIEGYMPGEILTLAELRVLPEDTVIHIHYLDEDGEEREDGFQKLSKDSETEWSAGAFPFPIDELKEEDELRKCDNGGWTFTIREAIPAKKGEYETMKKNQRKILNALEKMRSLYDKIQNEKDKTKKKELKKKYNEIAKIVNKAI